MPRFSATTCFDGTENDKIKRAMEKTKQSRYKLMHDAVVAHCEEILKGDVIEQKGGERIESGRGNILEEDGRQNQQTSSPERKRKQYLPTCFTRNPKN